MLRKRIGCTLFLGFLICFATSLAAGPVSADYTVEICSTQTSCSSGQSPYSYFLHAHPYGDMSNLAEDPEYADLSGLDLSHANFTGTDLSDADLSDSDLSYAIFTYTDLYWTVLTGADLSGADLSEAYNLDDAIYTDAIYDSLTSFPSGFDPEAEGLNIAPVAKIELSTSSGENPLYVDADAYGSTDSDGDIVSWLWELDFPGGAANEIGQDEFIDGGLLLMIDGDYLLTLTVTDNDGATHSTSSQITVPEPSGSVLAFSALITILGLRSSRRGPSRRIGER